MFREIGSARDELENGQRVPAGVLQALVADNWRRCQDLRPDPHGVPRHRVVDIAEVKRRRDYGAALGQLALAK